MSESGPRLLAGLEIMLAISCTCPGTSAASSYCGTCRLDSAVHSSLHCTNASTLTPCCLPPPRPPSLQLQQPSALEIHVVAVLPAVPQSAAHHEKRAL